MKFKEEHRANRGSHKKARSEKKALMDKEGKRYTKNNSYICIDNCILCVKCTSTWTSTYNKESKVPQNDFRRSSK